MITFQRILSIRRFPKYFHEILDNQRDVFLSLTKRRSLNIDHPYSGIGVFLNLTFLNHPFEIQTRCEDILTLMGEGLAEFPFVIKYTKKGVECQKPMLMINKIRHFLLHSNATLLLGEIGGDGLKAVIDLKRYSHFPKGLNNSIFDPV